MTDMECSVLIICELFWPVVIMLGAAGLIFYAGWYFGVRPFYKATEQYAADVNKKSQHEIKMPFVNPNIEAYLIEANRTSSRSGGNGSNHKNNKSYVNPAVEAYLSD
ncbi:MAG: hypothetical protein L7F77_01665 [Candidatus Magnetominusculus sp. LBB02]|nr:hypothetical protein [Candidatus Magnetominusculus sp. LBB02]